MTTSCGHYISCKRLLVLLLGLVIGGTCANVAAETDFIVTADSVPLALPFSDAVAVNGVMYLSGQLGVDTSTFMLVEGGIEAETRQIFANMSALLATRNASLSDIFKCTVMIADIAEWPAFNRIYVEYLPGPKPARSAFGANGLALDAAVELECWANLPD